MVNFLWISAGSNDIIDEAIYFFKANVFFKSYEIKVLLFSTAELWFQCLVQIMKDVTTSVHNSHHAYFPFCDTNLGWLLKK